MLTAAIYARVSTSRQNLQRQIRDCEEELEQSAYDIGDVRKYTDVHTGSENLERGRYQELWRDIEAGEVDLVITSESSRISRTGSQEFLAFINHCLEHGVALEVLSMPISFKFGDSELEQAINRVVAALMAELDALELAQKKERINSGIAAAQDAGVWTGGEPTGFRLDKKAEGGDGRLHVDVDEFLRFRRALERIADGESQRSVAQSSSFTRTLLNKAYNHQRELYFRAEPEAVYEDGQKAAKVRAALEESGLLPLDEPAGGTEDEQLEQLADLVAERLEGD